MRIECPGCEAAYEVPESQIRPGRSVRCARCEIEWRPAGNAPEPEPRSGTAIRQAGGVALRRRADLMAPQDASAVAARSRLAPGTGWSIGWAASLIVLAGLLGSAVHWRQTIMQGWPPSIRLYTVLGAPPHRS